VDPWQAGLDDVVSFTDLRRRFRGARLRPSRRRLAGFFIKNSL
jgi:hypothetical protein